MPNSSIILTLPGSVTDPTGLSSLARDALLEDANDGVLFLFDLARQFCWPGGDPVHLAEVGDLSENGNGEWSIESGADAAIIGNGLDLADNTVGMTACILAPASVSASLYGAGASAQHWLACLYAKLPTVGNWWSDVALGPLLKFADDNYTVGAEHFLLAVANTPSFQLRRSTGSGTVETVAIAAGNLTPHYGLITQILAYRNASGTFLRLKSSGGTTSASIAAAASNPQNFSALRPQFGSGLGAWTLYGVRAPRLYRGWIEDLATSGRDPTTVADEDYSRTIARGVFS